MKNYHFHKKYQFFKLLNAIIVTVLIVEVATAGFVSAAEKKQKEMSGRQQEIQADSAPGHVILYDDTLTPEWKPTWDLARQLYRDKKYREALVQYEILLSLKETVNEARWEYASILLHLERWDKASVQLEQLLAYDGKNKKYLFAMAKASLKCGNTEKAVNIYTRLLDTPLDGPETRQALEGIVLVQELRGNQEAILPLVEQLIEMQPGDFTLRKKQAKLLFAQGDYKQAAEVIDTLKKQEPDDVDVLWMQSRLLIRAGDTEGMAACLQKLIGIDPENLDAHSELKKYYAGRKNWSMSFKHLEVMLKATPNDTVLLEEAGVLSVKLGRVDEALNYYDYCLALKPGNASVVVKKSEAQKILARDLLVLVENDGTEKLWQDLVKVTVDRPGVYREIAVLLREKKQTSELIEVLTLLYNENPGDEPTYHELAMLLEENGRTSELGVLQRKRNKSGSTVQ